MNEVTKTDNRLMKTLAVLGFVVVIIFLVWLAVRLVSLLPGAFASLADMAENVYNRQETTNVIVIDTDTMIVNSKESFAISWNDLNKSGHYAVSYSCTDGVSLDIRLPSGAIAPVSCGEDYQLPTDTLSIDMLFASEKTRFADVSYSIMFVPSGQSDPTVTGSKALTVVNSAIPADGVADTTESDTDTTEDTTSTTSKPTNSTPTTPTYRYVYKTTYQVPVSDPNGYTDLAVSFVGIGTMQNNQFVPTNQLVTRDNGAFQFKVKNIGTKTSSTWAYEADLPTDETYRSGSQVALKPNEEALITIVFGRVHDDGTQRFGAEINGGNDNNSVNDRFTATVRIDN